MKKSIIGIVIGILIGTVSTVVASSYIAKSISYTPKDTSWGVDNVEAAIDSLYLSKAGDNYSTSEKVVGTWVDGKELYQKTIVWTDFTKTSEAKTYSLDLSSLSFDHIHIVEQELYHSSIDLVKLDSGYRTDNDYSRILVNTANKSSIYKFRRLF